MKRIIFLLLTSRLFGQTSLPTKDSTIYNSDGSIIQYQVLDHAVYMKTIKDQMSNGPFKAFYKNGKLWHSDNRVNNKIEGTAYDFTPNGDTAKIEEWKNSSRINSIVFYSSHSSKPQKYYFVSKKGFTTLNNKKYFTPNESTPDSLIEDMGECAYMWLKGKRQPFYGECRRFELIKTGDKPGLYSIKGDKKEFIRPLTDKEKKEK
ncbi:MAG: hypothetical protein ACK50A_05855 [Sphingobacteriaceae bacterium]|jgi:hypothetical protein